LSLVNFRNFQKRGCTSDFVVLSYRRWRKCLSDIRPDNCRSGSFSTSFLFSESLNKVKGKEQCKLHRWDRNHLRISERPSFRRLVQYVLLPWYPFWI